jgi:hypothetical protein
LYGVVAGAQASVEGDTVEPSTQVGGRDAPAQHTLEVDGEVEGYAPYIVGVNEDDVGGPVGFAHRMV